MIERSGERNDAPLRGLCGKTDLITFQGEIALDLLPRMGKDQVLEGEPVFGFSYLSWTDTNRLFVCVDFLIQLFIFCRSEGCFGKGRLHPWHLSVGDFYVRGKL